MKKVSSLFLSAVMAATSVVAFTASADAQRSSRYERERYVENYCRRNPRDRDCRTDRSRWDERRYQSWYRDRHRGNGAGAAAAGIFGFAAGAIAGAAAGAASGAADGTRRARCEVRYRSYDWRSNTYVGNDGRRHECRL